MNQEQWIKPLLSDWEKHLSIRHMSVYPAVGGKFHDGEQEWLNFSCNDYLNLARHPDVIRESERALLEFGSGATASRLVTGTLPVHDKLERALAEFKGYPSAVLFGSGYMANAGTVTASVSRNDQIFVDRLVHASVIDAAILSRAKLVRYKHNDPSHLEHLLKQRNRQGRQLIITESVFSMDGDLAPLEDIAHVAERHGAIIMIDEAHATGVFGTCGRGRINDIGLKNKINISMGTLSKSLGGYGGFVTCSNMMRELLINRARSLIYTTAPPPAVAGAALGALNVIAKNPGLGGTLLQRADKFRELLKKGGLDTINSESQIIPILIGNNEKVLSLSLRLRDKGILAVAIRPPTVPPNGARLRLSVTLAHTEDDLSSAADIILDTARKEGIL